MDRDEGEGNDEEEDGPIPVDPASRVGSIVQPTGNLKKSGLFFSSKGIARFKERKLLLLLGLYRSDLAGYPARFPAK